MKVRLTKETYMIALSTRKFYLQDGFFFRYLQIKFDEIVAIEAIILSTLRLQNLKLKRQTRQFIIFWRVYTVIAK